MTSHSPHPRVVYLSYDGAAEPLGQSQVVSYLERLAESAEITLISFEKSGAEREAVAERLAAAGIRWIPLAYHARPPVLSTWRDVIAGTRALDREAAERPPDIVHVRSYVPALMAYRSTARRHAKLLFDIRGFWADERVEGGIWRRGILYRIAKAYERRFFESADAVVTLTNASVPFIEPKVAGRNVPIVVIPTCVDVQKYKGTEPRPEGRHAVWNGSVGTWYRFDLGMRLARELAMPLTVLTRQQDLARQMLGDHKADVRSVEPENIPQELHEGDIGLCLVRPSFSKIASAPTRFGEHLAAGSPVVVTAGVGDLEELVRAHGVGVVVRDESDVALRDAAEAGSRLAADPDAPKRCRRVAREVLDLGIGVERYASLYSSLTRSSGSMPSGDSRVQRSS